MNTIKRLRSELRICLSENQNKEKKPFLKIASSETLARVLESLGELYKVLDCRLLLTKAVIEMFLESSCTFHNKQNYTI